MSIRAMPDRRIVTHSLFCGLGVLGLAVAVATSPAAAEMPATSGDVAYATAAGVAPARLATSGDDPRIVVSIEKRHLWLIDGRDTLMSVPAAVGMGKEVDLLGHSFYFATPEGVRRVLAKKGDPLWIVPDWHYYEVAEDEGLEIVWMKPGERYDLSDGSYLEMRGDSVGRVNTFGNFWAVQPGLEIIYDGKLFVPPKTSPQRHIPDALGPYKLVLGDGYLIHGVNDYDEESVGKAVSHGCIRLSNEDLEKLYNLVPVGTRVVIR